MRISMKINVASKKDFSDSLVMAVMKKIDQMRPCEKYVFSMKINVLDVFSVKINVLDVFYIYIYIYMHIYMYAL